MIELRQSNSVSMRARTRFREKPEIDFPYFALAMAFVCEQTRAHICTVYIRLGHFACIAGVACALLCAASAAAAVVLLMRLEDTFRNEELGWIHYFVSHRIVVVVAYFLKISCNKET